MHFTPETLIDYLHRELPPGEDARVLAHLETCTVCTAELNAEAAITERLRAYARAETQEMPAGVRSAVLQHIRTAAAQPTFLERLQAALRPLVAVPLAAAAVAAIVIFGPASHRSATSPVTLPVSYYLEEHAAHVQENPLADRSAALMMVPAASLEPMAQRGQQPALIHTASIVSFADDSAR
ncbi:MAG: zf-HC2 domain-containing protein [Candidatus Eremiobacteraeota bacterium]|nr:zf-HC2 domain-containing protein [Candidatus Eremiobacteraeota bacterium]MBV8354903.1 zf-HC2 domain-containing protein [Candidatus Eremiobacteraeota bacterium]